MFAYVHVYVCNYTPKLIVLKNQPNYETDALYVIFVTISNERTINRKENTPTTKYSFWCILSIYIYNTYNNVYTYINVQYTLQLTCKICKRAYIIRSRPNIFCLIWIPYIKTIYN